MNNKFIERRRPENALLRKRIDDLLAQGNSFLKKNLKDLDISDYKYRIEEAIEELSLDEETVRQLIEDYIIQILKSKILFYKYIDELEKNISLNKIPDYTSIRELAHKNLGVVKNLRITDAREILVELMKKDDLDHLRSCVKALEISAVRLNPLCAYETLRLMDVKNSL